MKGNGRLEVKAGGLQENSPAGNSAHDPLKLYKKKNKKKKQVLAAQSPEDKLSSPAACPCRCFIHALGWSTPKKDLGGILLPPLSPFSAGSCQTSQGLQDPGGFRLFQPPAGIQNKLGTEA